MNNWLRRMTWFNSNDYGSLTQDERYHNAQNVYYFFKTLWGWRTEAIAALAGNMEAESWLSPTQWQGGDAWSGGLGLLQWTPYTLLTDWAQDNGLDPFDGLTQLKRLVYEYQNGLEYYQTPLFPYPPYTWYQFAHTDIGSDGNYITVEQATEAFVWCYLRPADPSATMANRKSAANKYFDYFQTLPPNPPGYIPYWLLFKMRKGGLSNQ